MRIATMVIVAGLVAGCGGDDGEDLTCELLADTGNCWAEAAAAATACLPEVDGTLSEDRTFCEFADQTRIEFDAPVPVNVTDLDRLAFDVERPDGTTCARFVDTFENRIELTIGDGDPVVAELSAGGRFELTCGGSSYSTSFDQLFECDLGNGPGDGYSASEFQVSVTLLSSATPDPWFRCQPAPTSR